MNNLPTLLTGIAGSVSFTGVGTSSVSLAGTGSVSFTGVGAGSVSFTGAAAVSVAGVGAVSVIRVSV